MESVSEKTPEQLAHEGNKAVRQGLAFAHYVLTHQTRFMHEQFIDASNAVAVIFAVCEDLQKKIEQVEPPAPQPEVSSKPWVIDAPQAAEAQAQQ